MRAPAESSGATAPAEFAVRELQPKPEGGKALARLREFSHLRGLPVVAQEGAVEAPTEAPTRPRRRAAAAAPDDAGDAADIARTYAETGIALQGLRQPTLAASQAAGMVLQGRSEGELPPGETAESAEGAPTSHAPGGPTEGALPPGGAARSGEDAPTGEAAADLAAVTETAPAAAVVPAWRPLGPAMMPNGQTYGSGRTIVSGRVSSIAIDPANGNHILCGSAGGGVWESADGGTTWAPRTDFAPTLTVGAVAFAPSAPGTVYCGTGEGNFYAALGAGVLKSGDGGTTWALVAGSPFFGQGFYDIAVDPVNANHVLAATTSGLYESTDGGVKWTRRRSQRTWSLAYQPSGGAAAEVLAACADGLFRSTNGGTSWTAVAVTGAPAGWNRLAVSMVRSDSRVAYLFGSTGSAGLAYRRSAAGAWAAISVPADLNVGQDWYDWCLMAAPDRDNQVYVGAIDSYRGDRSGTTWTWTKITAKASGDSIHPDQHAFALHPTDPAQLFAGNDGGLYRSPNRGVNWTPLNNGLAITEIEYIAQDFGSTRLILGGTQDNGSIRYTGSPVWEHTQDGDGGDCGINRPLPAVCFHSFFGMGMERSTTGGGWTSWSWVGPNVPQNYGALFYPPLEVNGETVAQAGQSVFISRNRGSNWSEAALAANVVATAMHAPTGDRVFVGTDTGRVFRFDWRAPSWARTELTAPRSGAGVSDLHVEGGDPNRLWVTYRALSGGRAFVSTDGGSTWTDRSAGLPALPLNAVGIDPGNGNRVWVAADLGVYQSTNGGVNWAVFGADLPNVLVADLIFHPHARVLRAGTRNRGVWEIPVDGWLTQPICGTQFQGSLAANQSQRWFTFNWPATWHVVWTVMPTTVRSGAPELTWVTQVERASAEYVTYWISVTNLTSAPVDFEGRFAILSKY